MEQALQQEQHRACVLQHSLDDRIAELDLERVAKEVRIWANEAVFSSHGCLKMWWCAVNLWLEPDKTPFAVMHRMLTIIKLPGYRSRVIFNNTSVGLQASSSLRGCSVFVYFIISMFVFVCRHWNKTWPLVTRRTPSWNHRIRKRKLNLQPLQKLCTGKTNLCQSKVEFLTNYNTFYNAAH